MKISSLEERLSLSTCWCSRRFTDGYEMAESMRELGFKRIELSHGVRVSLVPGLLRAVEDGVVEISSVHNFCPLPNGVQHAAPNLYQPSSKNRQELDLWRRYSLQTLDFAVRVGAPKVVMHSGSMHFFFRSPEARLEEWLDDAELEAEQYVEDATFLKQRDRAMKKIRRSARPWLSRVVQSYQSLFGEAASRGLTLGLENREGLEEIPLDDGFVDFFEQLGADAPVGYWHDTGHAQVKDQFGLLDHEAHLKRMSSRLIGFHLHDVSSSGRDHQPIGSGVIDFEMISRYVRPEHALILELSPKLSEAQVLRSKEAILDLFV